MSILESLLPAAVQAILGKVIGGDKAPTITTTASAATDVTVNPEITAINVIDTRPLADALSAINLNAEKLGGAVQNAQENLSHNLKLIAAGLAVFFVVKRAWK